MHLTDTVDTHEVARYFTALGYEVDWDFKTATGERWYEISDDEGLVCQVDMGIPLADIIADFTHWDKHPKATKGVSDGDYKVNLPPGKRSRLLLKRVTEKGVLL